MDRDENAGETDAPGGRASISAWVLAARPKTLLAAVVPVWVGCVLAIHQEGMFSLPLALWTVASATLIQIATNLFNDAIDFHKGADTAARVGPKRITASGGASPRAVLAAAGIVAVGAALAAVPLIIERGWPIVAIGLPSLYLSFGYTGGPVPLAYRGLGEIFVLFFFGIVAVAGTFFVQTGNWSVAAVMLGLQIGALSTVLIAVNNLRDIDEDRRSGKRTLAVRRGLHFGRVEITTLCLAPHAIGIHWVTSGDPALWTWPLLALPLGVAISSGVVRHPPGPVYNRFLGLAALQMLVFGALFTLAAFVSR